MRYGDISKSIRQFCPFPFVSTAQRESILEAALQERCDGNRNILHACVSKSFPVSAHEPGETTESQVNSGAGSNNGALGNKLESIKGAVDALAAAVAAAAAAVRSSGKSCCLKLQSLWAFQMTDV